MDHLMRWKLFLYEVADAGQMLARDHTGIQGWSQAAVTNYHPLSGLEQHGSNIP